MISRIRGILSKSELRVNMITRIRGILENLGVLEVRHGWNWFEINEHNEMTEITGPCLFKILNVS